ncbi:NAD kinase [Nostocoides jenkinsii]|uniref:NAD kinase n=1 Tax=Nostocoides jenkinsii Ben 74 TaxID=1193518 RepID=A0A077MAJ5_9MICO|nr:NAD kinase [Tetrasphaera jenkinsii]CCI51807.1 putative inorganic polyphosphate/ATP-NAD kinase 2 [Tetrasphaera jenkinsii Ben 74]
MTRADRRILLVLHPRRPEAAALAGAVVTRLTSAGVDVVLDPSDAEHLGNPLPDGAVASDAAMLADGCELVLVLGGDGTILRGAELSRGSGVPLLGINLGHVGFLAESEKDESHETIERILERDYQVEDRMTLDVCATVDGRPLTSTWALNEATVEKAARERMLELTAEIDGRPLSTWGCDGVVISTPTGSTAYAFSAGGPIVWPNLDAILLVPISAHALFSRPVVVGPDSRLAVDVVPHNEGHGVLWCDGRRAIDLPPGARIEVRRSGEPVRLARLGSQPFTDRLVEKFALPVGGWRGAARARTVGEA